MFTFIFLSLFVSGWLFCGLVPWLVVSVWTRGRAGMAMLALCLFAAVVAGLATPLLGLDGGLGLGLSFLFAGVVPAGLLVARQAAGLNPASGTPAVAADDYSSEPLSADGASEP